MTEDDARERVAALVGDAAGVARLERLVALVIAENEQQNLIARSTIATIWHRHVLDSVQLLPLAGAHDGLWIDIGTGGGFPGLAVAAATERPMLLVEPRGRRAAFLREAVAALGLNGVSVAASRVEQLRPADVGQSAAIVTARAVATPVSLADVATHLCGGATRWLLQRGAAWHDDLMTLRENWTGVFHVKHSVASDEGRILVVDGLRRR